MELTMTGKKSWRRTALTAAVAAALTGMWGIAGAADYQQGLTGSTKDASWLTEGTVTEKNGTLTYDFGGKNQSFTTKNTDAVSFAADTNAVINNKGSTLTLKNTNTVDNAWAGTSGLSVTDGSNVTINSNLNIDVFADYAASGISVERGGTGSGSETHLTINGDVTMRKNDAESPWAIVTNNIHGNPETMGAPDYRGARWAPSGISLGMSDGSSIDINGNVDLAVRGTAVKTDPWSQGKKSAVINLNGGNVRIETPKDKNESFFSLANYGGTINVNVKDGAVADASHMVDMKGNIITMKENNGSGMSTFYTDGQTNIALANDKSQWTGVIDNSGKSQAGEVNLWIANGGTWDHQSMSKTNGLDAANMPSPSNQHYGKYNGMSYVNHLSGGADAKSAGYILQNDTAKIDITKLSGYATIIYNHTGTGTSASDYTAGDVTIHNADADSFVTLSTSSAGVKMDDSTQVQQVLSALAQKLTYSAYASGEKNLKGQVQIASGLTTSSAVLQVGELGFDANGKGTAGNVTPSGQTVTKFTTSITGDAAVDTEYVDGGVLKDGTYTFTVDKTTIEAAKPAAIAGGPFMFGNITASIAAAADHSADIQMNGHSLEIKGSAVSGIAAIGTGKTEIHDLGASTIDMNGRAALFVNGGGQILIHNGGTNAEDNVLTLRAGGSNPNSVAVVKAMNGQKGAASQIIIDGLADILADGNAADGKKANEAVSVVASTVEIGGGSIKAVNGAQYAIRAYGEFTNPDQFGVVNVNVLKDKNGNITGADSNKTIVEGNIATRGGMGSKGQISVGLSTKDSYWKGNYKDSTGYGVTPGQLGNVNLFMSNGADWTGYSTGTMSVQMDSGATWHGFNTSDNFVLDLKNGAEWYNTNTVSATAGDSTLKDKTSKISYLNGGSDDAGRGYIDMTAEDVKDLDIANYSGYTTVFYSHDETNPTVINGGNVTIGKAASGSEITLMTNSAGIITSDRAQVASVLDALAQKLTYSAYAENEKNLTGKVQIASGLTSSAISLATGNITFSQDGKGSFSGTVEYPDAPEHQTETEFDAAITGDRNTDAVYVLTGVLKEDGSYQFEKDSKITIGATKGAAIQVKNGMLINAKDSELVLSTTDSAAAVDQTTASKVNITVGTLTINASNTTSTAKGINANVGGSDTDRSEMNIIGNVNINANGSSGAQGIYAGMSDVTITGDVTMKKDGGYGIDGGDGYSYYGKSAIYATSKMGSTAGAVVKVDGNVDLVVNANGLYSNAGGSKISVNGGSIELKKDDSETAAGYAALRAEDGIINMNVIEDEKGNVTGTGTNRVNIKGNVAVTTGAVNEWDTLGTLAQVNLGLTTKDSSLDGVIYNAYGSEGVQAGDLTFKGESNLWLANGATWINEAYGATGESRRGKDFDGSYVTNFHGGSDEKSAGTIIQKDSNLLTIDNYSGWTTVIYDHSGAGDKAADYAAGNVIIGKAAVGSGVTLSTSSKGINMTSKDSVEKTLSALAQKLIYKDYAGNEKNLTGKVQIASGLTSSSAALWVGAMNFADHGVGSYTAGSAEELIQYSDAESAMMKGVRSAVTTSALAFRDTAASVFEREDVLSAAKTGEGTWAKVYGGKTKYDGSSTSIDNNYWAAQAGYAKAYSQGWVAGIGVDYRDDDASYIYGGTGDASLYTIGVFASKDLGDLGYFDISAKAGHVENKFHVYNEIGEKLDGKYSSRGYSVSAKYGKRFESGAGYVEPYAQVTWAHLDGEDYTASSTQLGTLNIHQNEFNSLVGRLGVEAGRGAGWSGFYGRLSLAHEFKGDLKGTYAAGNEEGKSTKFDLGDTWVEATLGGRYAVNDATSVYGDITRSFGGDYEQTWKINAGLRFSF